MMKNTYLLGLLALFLLTSCKEDVGDFTMNFKATYDGDPLVLLETLEYPGYDINIVESEFYISNISLLQGDERVQLADIDYVDFTNNNFNLERASEGIDFNYAEIPSGTYDGVEFTIGVQAAENAMLPNAFESDNPLSKSGNYWAAWDSYIFAKLGGNFRGDSGNLSNGWFFHTGTDGLLRTFVIDKDIVIDDSKSASASITMDHKILLQTGGEYFDIENSFANHDPTNLGPLEMIVNNYSSSFTFD